jgi:hypothetical protein
MPQEGANWTSWKEKILITSLVCRVKFMYYKIFKILNSARKGLRRFPGLFKQGKTGGQNIYHCCIQKSASQWIKSMLSDQVVYKKIHMKIHIPHKNFLGADSVKDLLENPLPGNKIITPLYIDFQDFQKISKPGKYKAFFVMRDPRDILISWYFSTRYSHPKNPSIKKRREILNAMDDDEAIAYLCKNVYNKNNPLYKAMRTWYLDGKEREEIIVSRYEELVGERKINAFKQLMDHIGIELSKTDVEHLLEKYSFKKLSKGRDAGSEDVKSHYRKGVSGDWQNYFTDRHKKIFKEENGQLLIDLDYEKNMDW